MDGVSSLVLDVLVLDVLVLDVLVLDVLVLDVLVLDVLIIFVRLWLQIDCLGRNRRIVIVVGTYKRFICVALGQFGWGHLTLTPTCGLHCVFVWTIDGLGALCVHCDLGGGRKVCGFQARRSDLPKIDEQADLHANGEFCGAAANSCLRDAWSPADAIKQICTRFWRNSL